MEHIKVTEHVQRTYTMELGSVEKEWLQGYLQNALYNESPKDAKMRKLFFNALKSQENGAG